jgi:hypothetical protein
LIDAVVIFSGPIRTGSILPEICNTSEGSGTKSNTDVFPVIKEAIASDRPKF